MKAKEYYLEFIPEEKLNKNDQVLTTSSLPHCGHLTGNSAGSSINKNSQVLHLK